jgi:hypothetical protein
MTKLARVGSVLAVSVAAIALPQSSSGGTMMKRTVPHTSDFARYLPPIEEVPWLRLGTGSRPVVDLPKAGTVSALLFAPNPAAIWPERYTQSAAAGLAPVSM